MKNSIFAMLIFLCSCQYRFEHRFGERVSTAPIVLFDDSLAMNAEMRLNLQGFDQQQVGSVLFGAINRERHSRHREPLLFDTLYNQIAQTILSDFDGRKFLSSRTWSDQRQSIRYLLQIKQAKNKVYSLHAFRLDMLDLDQGTAYYYDKNPGTSPLDLYKGRKEKKVTVPQDPVALLPVTAAQLESRFIEYLDHASGGRDLYSKDHSVLGIGVKPDPNIVNHTERPRLLIVVIFGGKKLNRVKFPKQVQDEMYNTR